MLQEIRRLIKEIGADHCKEVIAPLGLPPVAQANAHELNRIVTALLAEGTRLDCLSVFQWKALAKEIGPDAAGAIATQVSTEPGQAPEDWDWHQLDRAIKAAKRLTAGRRNEDLRDRPRQRDLVVGAARDLRNVASAP